jgi:hypothetical protein
MSVGTGSVRARAGVCRFSHDHSPVLFTTIPTLAAGPRDGVSRATPSSSGAEPVNENETVGFGISELLTYPGAEMSGLARCRPDGSRGVRGPGKANPRTGRSLSTKMRQWVSEFSVASPPWSRVRRPRSRSRAAAA